MKTILLPIYNGLRARMFFRTDTYTELVKDSQIRLVVIVPPHKAEYYRKEYPEKNVIFEPLNMVNEHWFGNKLVRIAFNLLPTSTIRGKQKLYLHRYGKYWKFWLVRAANYTLGPLPFVKEFIRALDRFVPLDKQVVALLDKYHPDIVFIPDIIFGPDRIFARAAKRKKIYIIGTPRSWDNLTSKGFAIAKPDKLLVLTSRMVPEAIKYAGMKRRDVIVTGPPQYDMYYTKPSKTREEFCKELGIPSHRRIVLCSPFFDQYTGSAVRIINALTTAIEKGMLPRDTHILVRYRPATPPIKDGLLNQSDHLTITEPCSLTFPVNDLISPTHDTEWSLSDYHLLVNSLRYSDVLINIVSTLSVDAMVYDTPVINVRFDADPDCPPKHSVNVMLPEHDHFKAVEATRGVRLVWNMKELIGAINAYFENPKLDFEGRECLRREQIELQDGGAGKRIAQIIKETLHSPEQHSKCDTLNEYNSEPT